MAALIVVHGGAYWTGDDTDAMVVARCQAFAAKGMAVFDIDYRLDGDQGQVPVDWPRADKDNMTWIPTYAYPAVRDTKAAVRWLRANAGKYNVDVNKIAIFGESAGSCSSIAVGMTEEDDYKSELTVAEDPTLATTHLEQSSKVAAVLDHWGSDDMATQLTARDGIVRYTATNAPIAIFHGTADGLVPYENALELEGNYTKTGVAHQLFPLAGQGHGCWNARTAQNQTQDDAGYDFLARILHLDANLNEKEAASRPPPPSASASASATATEVQASAKEGVRCSTCKGPVHSWKTLPVSFHSATERTGPTGLFPAEDMEIIAKFPLVTIEKWQGDMATDPGTNTSLFLWEEDAMIAAAKQIKTRNPATSVIAWFDTLMVYTGWNVDPANTTVNTTFNKGATVNCATGHFRPAEYLEQEGRSLLLRNGSNQLVHNSYGGCHVYDHSQAATRQYVRIPFAFRT